MIIGAHSIIYSTNPEADRVFLRDLFKLPNVDVGEGWLIFGLPPAELAVHPSDRNDVHELYLMCDDIDAFVAGMKAQNLACSPLQRQEWGVLTRVSLPGGGQLGVYEPRHARPGPSTPHGDSPARKPLAGSNRGKAAARKGSKPRVR